MVLRVCPSTWLGAPASLPACCACIGSEGTRRQGCRRSQPAPYSVHRLMRYVFWVLGACPVQEPLATEDQIPK